MSAIRSRRSSRPPQLPYARPAQKKSSWSITGFLKSLNPWSSSPSNIEEDEEPVLQDDLMDVFNTPASSLKTRGQQLERELGNPGHPSPSIVPPPPRLFSPQKSSTPSTLLGISSNDDLETMSTRIRESLDRKEVEKLCSMLQDDLSEEAFQPFRFSASPSATRGSSPINGKNNGPLFTFGASSSTSAAPTRKTLNRNPNGVYRWQGGGSAKTPRSKNRYSSPAFGPSRSTTERLVLKDTQIGIDTPRTDNKRRKVAEDIGAVSSSSSPSSSSSYSAKPSERATAPEPSPTRVKKDLPFPVSTSSPATSRSSGPASSTTSRPRVPPAIQKPTIPVVPSPLRQAWSGAPPPSRSDIVPAITPSPPKQTKAANFMTELIKEVTPPKRPDLSNPYQTASPLGKVAPKGRVTRRTRATGKPTMPTANDVASKEKEIADKEKTYSPQAIIEATLPKGSKRSRPPAHLEKIPLSDSQTTEPVNKRRAPYDESGDDDEDAQPTIKKSKTHLISLPDTSLTSSSPDIEIEEIEVGDASSVAPEKPQSITSPLKASAPSWPPGRQSFSGLKSASAPKEPSKLRYSYQVDTSPENAPPTTSFLASESSPTSSFQPSASIPAAPAPLFSSFTPKASATQVPSSFPSSVDKAASLSSTSSSDPGKSHSPAQQAALRVPSSALPNFTFSIKVHVPVTDGPNAKAVSEAKSLSKDSLPSFDFGKPVSKTITADTTTLSLPASTPIVPFDWAAAGTKLPSKAKDNTWTCSLCMLTNSVSATEQCEHCEAKRPAPATPPVAPKPTPPPLVQGFNWAAAGVKPPSVGDSWTCSICCVSNRVSSEKCVACENPR
ncbi:hypothetical protein H0H93_010969 [Arthromyces matolae]|nr:hypothetical protein H0H93_010969 [Arthromyces matolae]